MKEKVEQMIADMEQQGKETILFNSGIHGWSFLSNFHPCLVEYDGRMYACAEGAYQAAKTTDEILRLPFETMNGITAKRAGRQLAMRKDWNAVKVDIMLEILKSKFDPAINPHLAEGLEATSVIPLIEYAPWDGFWGTGKDGKGRNMMGILLEKVRHFNGMGRF